jgi:tetratricopeptide (TPR) repeat protein
MGGMMEKRVRRMAAVLVVVAALGLTAWWALPRVMAALPGRVRQYVPEAVIERVTTPLPTALPPENPAPAALELALAVPATATLVSTATAVPAATSSPQPVGDRLPVATPLPPVVRIDGLPIIPQKFNNCGPTNLTIALQYYGLDVDQFDVAGVVRPNYEDRNVSPNELVRYVEEQTDLRAAAYVGGDIDLLRRLIHAGFPVIIEKGLEPDEATGWMGHYLTVYGYEDLTGQLLARDTYLGPWRGDGRAGYRETERYWAQFNNTFVVVFPAAREAELVALLGPTLADPAAMWTAATTAARETARLVPGDAFAWFNLGTGLTETARLTGDAALYQAAAAAYDQARLVGLPARMLWYQFGPYEAYLAVGRHADALALAEATLASQGGRNVEETYLYQGRALLLAGDAAGARAALARAAELNPQSPVGLAARAALDGSAD